MESNHDDFEEEEVLVYANFEDGSVDRDIFQNSDLKFKIIGLDSDTPIVQLGDQTFKGSWKDTIGTKVFFEEDTSPVQFDPVFSIKPSKMLKYKCLSTKTLDLKRIFLKLKIGDQVQNKNDRESNINYDKSGEQEEVLKLAESTVSPDLNTNKIMRDIVSESVIKNT